MPQARFPERLVIEPTTRCNYNCDYCVKQSAGCRILEGDLSDDVFDQCKPVLSHLSSVIFTGVGEPLLHPGLEHYINEAAALVPPGSTIGFQTNGKLLTREKAVNLLKAGLTKICISVDTVKPGLFDQVRNGGTLADIDMALDAVFHARKQVPDNRLSVGIEFVLMKKNLEELPDVVQWAGRRGLDFVIVTHLTAYEKGLEKEQVFLNNSHKAKQLFEAFRQKAAQKDLDMMSYSPNMVKFYNTPKEQMLCDMVSQFKNQALENDLYVNLFHLLSEQPGEYEKIRMIFDKAMACSEKNGVLLTLPRIRPKTDRFCRFVEENTVFVSWQGQVSPCYFLWHNYSCVRMGDTKHVDPFYFGDVNHTPLKSIWNDAAYARFRKNVKRYDYPNCHAWCEKRCDYVLEAPFTQDCYINDVPCCDCHWGLGLLNCLV